MLWAVTGVSGALALLAVTMALGARADLHDLEKELVRRQQGSADLSAEAQVAAKHALDVARDAAAKGALLDARVAEVALQRGQLDELIQSLSRSRDENAVADIDAAVRVAMQQSALTGSAEPLLVALRSADERLARLNQPRLERLRRAIAHDQDRVRGVGVPDIGTLLIKLDELVRLVDELPLLVDANGASRDWHGKSSTLNAGPAPATAGGAGVSATAGPGVVAASAPRVAAAAASASGKGAAARRTDEVKVDPPAAPPAWRLTVSRTLDDLWGEVRGLLRVTRIDQPEAMLVAPEQSYFLRENLKLRLLNARLSILSRQLDAAGSDLQSVVTVLHRYFDSSSRKSQLADELLHQIAQQSRLIGVPRPDETLAATAAAVIGR